MTKASIISKAGRMLGRRFGAEKVFLFGSYARGTANRHSDVDMLVVCPIKRNRFDMMVAMDRALKGLGFARDIVILSPKEFEIEKQIPGTIARPAWKEGKVLYEAK